MRTLTRTRTRARIQTRTRTRTSSSPTCRASRSSSTSTTCRTSASWRHVGGPRSNTHGNPRPLSADGWRGLLTPAWLAHPRARLTCACAPCSVRRREDGHRDDLRLQGLLQEHQLPAGGRLHRGQEEAHHPHVRPGQGRRPARGHQEGRVPGAPARAHLHVPRRSDAAARDHVAPDQGLPAREPQAAHRADAAGLRHLRQPGQRGPAPLPARRDLQTAAHAHQEGAELVP